MSIICLLFMSHFRLQDTCHCDSVNHFRRVLFICFRVASLSGRICLPQIITALRTVLFISHPLGVMNRSPLLYLFLLFIISISSFQFSIFIGCRIAGFRRGRIPVVRRLGGRALRSRRRCGICVRTLRV